MMRIVATTLLLCGLAAAASAQPADQKIEQVIVTAPRYHAGVTPNAIAHDFIGSFAMPSVLSEQISRWEIGICPAIYGMAPQYAQVMEQHLRAIAKQAGAPVKDKGCRSNLLVFFTAQPQVQLDALHAKNFENLGYHAVTTVTHPIQAWYATGITDLDGITNLDRDLMVSDIACDPMSPCEHLPMNKVGGWRGRTEVSSDLLYVTIIVDSAKTAHYQVGEIADYVVMLALSRSGDYGDCQLMPSITNLLSPNCDDKLKPSQITPTDIAYLRGVYKMDPGAKLLIQQDEIAAEMAASLGAGK